MHKKQLETQKGNIVYWVNENKDKDSLQLVFLPGLTADHRLFLKQIEYFRKDYKRKRRHLRCAESLPSSLSM